MKSPWWRYYPLSGGGSEGHVLELDLPLLLVPHLPLSPHIPALGFRVQGLGSRAEGLGFGVWGLGFRVYGFGV